MEFEVTREIVVPEDESDHGKWITCRTGPFTVDGDEPKIVRLKFHSVNNYWMKGLYFDYVELTPGMCVRACGAVNTA